MKRGLSLGGEQSGHIIFSDHLFTGDGIATALNVMRVMAETGRELARSGVGVGHLSSGSGERARAREGGSEAVPAVADVMDRVERRLSGPTAACWCDIRGPSRSCA